MPKMRPKHGTYFMNKEIYEMTDHPAAHLSLFSPISRDDWLTIFHHLNAHEIEEPVTKDSNFISPLSYRGDLEGSMKPRSVAAFLFDSLERYLEQNNGTPRDEIIQPQNTYFAPSEYDTYLRAADVFKKIRDRVEVKDLNAKEGDKFHWVLGPKSEPSEAPS
jgi:hypothetical protein